MATATILPSHLPTFLSQSKQNSFHPRWHPITTLPPLKCSSKFHLRLRCASPSFSPSITANDDVEKEAVDGTDALDDAGGKEEKFDWFSHWYPLAPICDLDKRVPHAKTVLGIDVVVWWDKVEGKWRVFGDRCPHRLAPLSEGRIDQWGRLQCVYHGWCFDGQGSCKLIPQAPRDGPEIHTSKRACATVYPSFEQNKIVWFWPSSDPEYEDISAKKKPPYIPELDDPSYTSMMGIRDINYGYEILVENLMDPSHVPYAHYGLMRFPKNPNSIDREGGKPLEISIQSMDSSGFFAKQDNGYSKFTSPCIFAAFPFQKASNPDPLESKKENGPQIEQRKFFLLFICIPVSPGKSRLIWCFPRNFGVWIDNIVPRWIFHTGQNLILDSDLYLLHLEERKIAELGGPSNWQKTCFVPTKADALVVGFRKWLKKYSDGQVCWGDTSSMDLPPTPPREQLMDRFRTHVEQCSSCLGALRWLKALEVSLQIFAVASIGIVAALKQNVLPTLRSAVVTAAVICFLASRWLSHFIYKNFYYHDYNHAFK